MPIVGFTLVLLLAACDCAAAADSDTLAVIVHRDRPESVSVTELSQIYLKKRKHWSDGAPIVPLNREASSSVRQTFSHLVYGARAQHLATYWNEQYFHGIFPPATLSSDAAVKQYVGHDANAIGYVAADSVDDSVRVVLILTTSERADPTPTAPFPPNTNSDEGTAD